MFRWGNHTRPHGQMLLIVVVLMGVMSALIIGGLTLTRSSLKRAGNKFRSETIVWNTDAAVRAVYEKARSSSYSLDTYSIEGDDGEFREYQHITNDYLRGLPFEDHGGSLRAVLYYNSRKESLHDTAADEDGDVRLTVFAPAGPDDIFRIVAEGFRTSYEARNDDPDSTEDDLARVKEEVLLRERTPFNAAQYYILEADLDDYTNSIEHNSKRTYWGSETSAHDFLTYVNGYVYTAGNSYFLGHVRFKNLVEAGGSFIYGDPLDLGLTEPPELNQEVEPGESVEIDIYGTSVQFDGGARANVTDPVIKPPRVEEDDDGEAPYQESILRERYLALAQTSIGQLIKIGAPARECTRRDVYLILDGDEAVWAARPSPMRDIRDCDPDADNTEYETLRSMDTRQTLNDANITFTRSSGARIDLREKNLIVVEDASVNIMGSTPHNVVVVSLMAFDFTKSIGNNLMYSASGPMAPRGRGEHYPAFSLIGDILTYLPDEKNGGRAYPMQIGGLNLVGEEVSTCSETDQPESFADAAKTCKRMRELEAMYDHSPFVGLVAADSDIIVSPFARSLYTSHEENHLVFSTLYMAAFRGGFHASLATAPANNSNRGGIKLFGSVLSRYDTFRWMGEDGGPTLGWAGPSEFLHDYNLKKMHSAYPDSPTPLILTTRSLRNPNLDEAS